MPCGCGNDETVTGDVTVTGSPTPRTPIGGPTAPLTPRPTPTPARPFLSSSLSAGTTKTTGHRTAAQPSFPPGTTIASRYRVVNLLGKGGMGEVYRAEDLTLDQDMALKFLPTTLTSDEAALERFHSEVRIARQIAHPNVCRVYDIGEAEGRIFLTMEYIDGEDLASLLRRIGRLPPDKALELARQLCAGLAAAHDNEVLHRDLKPANIMIDGRGRAHITDFGIAGLAGELKEDHSRAGTPAYMAPEQFAGDGVSVQSDIFSLGLILYEMFTGKRAFHAPTLAELTKAHEESATSPSTLVHDIDPLVERAIMRCLERDPRRRPTSALAVAAQLPGGDPVAAALAAGETPSPEMVAASGGEGALEVKTAWGILGLASVAMIGVVMLAPFSCDLGVAPAEKSPDVLVDHAREIVSKAGYNPSPHDNAYWFSRNIGFLRDRAMHLPKSQQIGDWKTAEQGAVRFFYRQSPRDLFPNPFSGSVDLTYPATNMSGMVAVSTEPNGAVVYFDAVPRQLTSHETSPPPSGPAPAEAASWPLFAESRLDASRFTPENPIWLPPSPFDQIAGWRGSYAQSPNTVIHVVAANYRGRPVYFEVIAPWTTANRDAGNPTTSTRANVAQRVVFGLVLGLVALSMVLAWRNWRMGRADHLGAVRIGVFVLCMDIARWLMRAHYVGTPQMEWQIFILGVALGLWAAGLGAIAYVALEPYVRRRWPQAMTSWTRVLAGRIRDPLVGADVLLGVALGAVVSFIMSIANASVVWFNLRGETTNGFESVALASFNGAASEIPTYAVNAVVNCLGIALYVFVIRVLIKRQWIAEAVAVLVIAPFLASGENLWLDIPGAVILIAATVLSCSRRGILTLIAFNFTLQVLTYMPVTPDPSVWYFNRTVLALAACAIPAVYAFRAALAGKPAFGTIFAE